MFKILANVFSIPELRNKILFTLGMLAIYRVGYWIPLPGVDQEALARQVGNAMQSDSALGQAASVVALFSGGNLSQATIFGLGIMPYISASIIFQLLGSALPSIKRIQEEGPTGRQKIMEWTRYAAVALAMIQGAFYLQLMRSQGLLNEGWASNPVWWLMALGAMTAGTCFLMWLGEQIDQFGIGNGASLIITAGILTGMPAAFGILQDRLDPRSDESIGLMGIVMLVVGFVVVVAGAVLLTVAQRRIPVQQQKHVSKGGQQVFGGQKSYLPLRVNHSGVMPIIFASSLMMLPSLLFAQLASASNALSGTTGLIVGEIAGFLDRGFAYGAFPYVLVFILTVYFFAYFWITVQFSPQDMAKQLRDQGSFIPGLRPGPRTAEYLDTVMTRITYCGAGILAIMAVLPTIVAVGFNIPFIVTQFLGGTGLLIVVSVTLDLIQRIEAALLMRNYAGFLGGDDGGPRKRIRGPRG